jgi:hypothetical protein
MNSRNGTLPQLPRRMVRVCSPLVAVLVAAFVGVGCADEAPTVASDAIPTESFVEAMVALRTSPAMGTSGFLPAGEPERILSERGLTPEDIRRFVEVHGENVPMMTDVWSQIESRVAEARGAVTEPGN